MVAFHEVCGVFSACGALSSEFGVASGLVLGVALSSVFGVASGLVLGVAFSSGGFRFSARSTKGHSDREEITHPCRSAAPSMARTLRSSEWPLVDFGLCRCFEKRFGELAI